MSDYRKLRVWQNAHALVLDVYQCTVRFPKDEQYALTAQIRRSAASIPANIAEGTGRTTQKELAYFCGVARGSLNELEYHLLLAHDLRYLPADAHAMLGSRLSELRGMLTKFMKTL